MKASNRIQDNNFLGKTFGYLTVLREIESKVKWKRYVEAVCKCGGVKEYGLYHILSGKTKSCGCAKRDCAIEKFTKHGLAKHPLYITYQSMKRRCYNPNSRGFKNWGGRGILVCDEWKNDFMAFYNWAIEKEWKKGLRLDRYPNKNGNYEPTNCRFATSKEDANNRRDTVMVLLDNVEMALSLACDKLGLNHTTIYQRMRKNGYNFEKAMNKIK